MFSPTLKISLIAAFCFLFSAKAFPDIIATRSPAGDLNIGDIITVTLSVTGAPTGVDGVSFLVDWDESVLSYVSNSVVIDGAANATSFLNDRDVPLPSDQNADVFILDDTDDSLAASDGRFDFTVFDDGPNAGDSGTGRTAGTLGSIQLQAIAAGNSNVVPVAPGGLKFDALGLGDVDDIFLAPDGISTINAPVGFGTMSTGSITVVPEPAIGLVLSILASCFGVCKAILWWKKRV